MFTDEEVLEDLQSSSWVRITVTNQWTLPQGNAAGAEHATPLLEDHFGSLQQRTAKGLVYNSDGK